MRWCGLAGLTLCAFGCLPSDPFGCNDDSQCAGGDGPGRCEASGYCSFQDDVCDSGWAYGEHASSDLAGQCVPVDTAGSTTTTSDPTSTSDPTLTSLSTTTTTTPTPTTSSATGTTATTTPLTSGSDSSTGPGACDPCAICDPCVEDSDCDVGICVGSLCKVVAQIEIDYVEDCADDPFVSQMLEDLPAGDYLASALASAGNKWPGDPSPPMQGWIYVADCDGIDFDEMRTPFGIAYATPEDAFVNLIAPQQSFTFGGGPLNCGLPDTPCTDNRGSVIFEIASECP